MLRILALCCLVLAAHSTSASLITPCKPADSACVMSSTKSAIGVFARGVPEMGIKPVDPLHLPLIESNHAGLKLTFKNTVITNLGNCEVISVKYDPVKMKQVVEIKCSVVMNGDYILDGQLIIMPVKGKGPFTITVDDLYIKGSFGLETVTGKDGKPHWHIAKRRHSFKVLTRAQFDFKNLFDGNKALGQPVLDFANTQWKDVMEEVAPPVVDACINELVDQVEALYAAVPASDLTL